MYKIGDKVETPLGIGSIYNISDEEYSDFTVELFGYEKHIVTLCNVNVKGQPLLYKDTDLKPYRTAHEKLIEMEWEYKAEENSYNKNNSDWIEISKHGYSVYHIIGIGETHPYLIDLELSRILTQYLEEITNETPFT